MSEREAIGTAFVAIKEQLSRLVARIVPPKDIEDIVQETYVRVCQVSHKNVHTPRAFMFRTARNLALDHIRRHENRFATSVEDNPGVGFGEGERSYNATYEQVAADEEFADFCDAVRELPVQCRRTFVLKKVYGYSQREIAEELGISESTVEKHVSLGIRRCTQHLLSRRTGDASEARGGTGRRSGRSL